MKRVIINSKVEIKWIFPNHEVSYTNGSKTYRHYAEPVGIDNNNIVYNISDKTYKPVKLGKLDKLKKPYLELADINIAKISKAYIEYHNDSDLRIMYPVLNDIPERLKICNVPLYRGIGLTKKDINSLKKTGIIESNYKASSWSTKKSVAKIFTMDIEKDEKGVIIRRTKYEPLLVTTLLFKEVPYIKRYLEYLGEQEVILMGSDVKSTDTFTFTEEE